jgi:PleD family two-component response regulator
LKETLREADLIGRYGGKKFAVISPETTLEQASKVAK